MFVSFLIIAIYASAALYVNWRSLVTLRRFKRGYGLVTCAQLFFGIMLAAFCLVGTDGKIGWQLYILLLAVIETVAYVAAIINSKSGQPSWEMQSVQPEPSDDHEPQIIATFEGHALHRSVSR